MRLLKTDHEVLEAMLRELIVQLEKSNFAWAYDAFDLFWGSLTVHINAETNFLFPALLNGDPGRLGHNDLPTYEELQRTIEQLKGDHETFMDQLEELMRELRSLVNSGPLNWDKRLAVEKIKRSLVSFSTWFQMHNETEEQKIHSLPAKILPAGDLVRLEIAVRTEIQNLPTRFAWAS
jgi:iron-sulfur cluster repair protein YtfE (RIC family)